MQSPQSQAAADTGKKTQHTLCIKHYPFASLILLMFLFCFMVCIVGIGYESEADFLLL